MKTVKNVIAAFAILFAIGAALVSYAGKFAVTQGYRAGVSTCTLQPISNISGSQNCDPSFNGVNCKILVGETQVDAYGTCSAATNPVTVTNLLKRNN